MLGLIGMCQLAHTRNRSVTLQWFGCLWTMPYSTHQLLKLLFSVFDCQWPKSTQKFNSTIMSKYRSSLADPILSFSHTFLPKSACIGGLCPPNGSTPPPMGNPGSTTEVIRSVVCKRMRSWFLKKVYP